MEGYWESAGTGLHWLVLQGAPRGSQGRSMHASKCRLRGKAACMLQLLPHDSNHPWICCRRWLGGRAGARGRGAAGGRARQLVRRLPAGALGKGEAGTLGGMLGHLPWQHGCCTLCSWAACMLEDGGHGGAAGGQGGRGDTSPPVTQPHLPSAAAGCGALQRVYWGVSQCKRLVLADQAAGESGRDGETWEQCQGGGVGIAAAPFFLSDSKSCHCLHVPSLNRGYPPSHGARPPLWPLPRRATPACGSCTQLA